MNYQTKLLLAAVAVTSVGSSVLAAPAPGVNPGSVTALPTTPRSVLAPGPVPAAPATPAPTGPCLAELSMNQVDVTRSADGATYNVSVTIANIGTEPAVGSQTAAGGTLGVSIAVLGIGRAQTYFVQMADINVIHPATSRTFTGSIPARQVTSLSREITARIDRGPDAPRCAYDARANNDGLGISVPTMRAWFTAGNATYTRVAPWAR